MRLGLLAFLGGLMSGAAVAQPAASIAPELDLSRPLLAEGQKIYAARCSSCHGRDGEGMTDEYADALVGDATVGELTRLIDETMPKGDPSQCVGPEAQAVAAYIHEAFYSEAAQLRLRPPRAGLARLTGQQLRQSLADLYASLDGVAASTPAQGLKGIYFAGPRWKDENKKLERIDAVLDFDFGRESPVEGLPPEEFYIYWEGGLRVDETGPYEIVVDSTCSFVMDFGKIGRRFIDNHVQSGDKTQFRRSVFLTAGRVYPFKLDFIQRKRKTEQPPARIRLGWVTPYGIEETIPARHWIPGAGPPTFSLSSSLPPDDRSYGYERGIAVSRQWDDSISAAAVEFGDAAADELWPRYRQKHRREEDTTRSQLRDFLTDLVGLAFRHPLTPEQQSLYIDRQLESVADDLEAIRQVVMLALKSPYFLYPSLDQQATPSRRIANRLALTLFDSLPTDEWLLTAAGKDQLVSEAAVRDAASRMVSDFRTATKIRNLLLEWLSVGQPAELSKSAELYPGFDRELAADLYASFVLMLDDIVQAPASDYRQLFSRNWYFTSPRLAAFYGPGWAVAEHSALAPRTASLADQRFGVLTHPYLMSRLSYHDATSPIHRGVFLIRYVLGRNLKPPSEAFAPLSPDLHPDLTTRERVTLQTQDDNCQACHIKINGLGFTLENYDAVGRFQTEDRGKPIDPRGSYTDRGDRVIELSGAGELAGYLETGEDAPRAFVSRAFQFFVKQPVAAYGNDTLDRLTAEFIENHYNIRQLIAEIAVVAAQGPLSADGRTSQASIRKLPN